VVCAYQDAWTRRDFEAAAVHLADDVVFHSPQQHITTLTDFIAMLTVFSERIVPRWELIAAATEGDNVLILYNLFTLDGGAATCADHFVVRSGRIQSEILVFDPKPFAAPSLQ
jgi:ketosteroid isomerase-like protein